MPPPPNTPDEAGRIAELDRYAILKTPPEAVFDRITALAARLFHCPIAVINFVAGERQWFKSCVGLNFTESARDVSICAWAILSDTVTVVPDARQDPRFADNCFVTAEGGIRFYAGAPIITPRGYNLGTLCIIDTVPRHAALSADEISTLRDLAAIVMSELDVRLAAQEAEQFKDLSQTTLSSIGDGVIATDNQGRVTFMNKIAQELTGWGQEDACALPIEKVFPIVNEITRNPVANPLVRAVAEERVMILENNTILLTKDGRELSIEDSAAPIHRQGAVAGGVLIFRDVTGRRAADRLLKHSEERFRNTFAGAPLGMVVTELDGRFIESNQTYRDITGYTEEELQSISFISLTHADEIEYNRSLFRKLIAREIDSYVIEKKIHPKSSGIRWVRAHGKLHFDANGKPETVIGLIEDISSRKDAEEQLTKAWTELRQARDLLQTTLSSIADGVIATDAEGRVTFLNAAAETVSGWQQVDALGRPIEEVLILVREDTTVKVENPATHSLRAGVVVGIANHTVLISKDGRHVPLDDSAAPIRDVQGRIVGSVLVFRDITERRKIEKQLADSEEFSRTVIESSPDCLKVLDLDGRMVSLNKDGCRQMEIDELSVCLFRYWPEFWSGEERSKAQSAVEAAKRGETSMFEGFCSTVKGSPRWWEVVVSPIRDASGMPVRLLAVSRDITQRKHIQSAMQAAHDKLEASTLELQRSNEDLSQFAHVASHDLRSPLRTILLFAQLMERKFGDALGADGKTYIGFLTGAAKRMGVLIEDLLEYASLSSGADALAAPVDLNAALTTAIENLGGSIHESRATITHEPLPTVPIDSTRLVQIFQNLLGNAIHYRSEDAPQIHLSSSDEGDWWLISCSDNGIGVGPEYRERIFEPFKRLHGSDRPGSGIGLAVCKKIVESYQGRIWVESNKPKGSIFFFTLLKPQN